MGVAVVVTLSPSVVQSTKYATSTREYRSRAFCVHAKLSTMNAKFSLLKELSGK